MSAAFPEYIQSSDEEDDRKPKAKPSENWMRTSSLSSDDEAKDGSTTTGDNVVTPVKAGRMEGTAYSLNFCPGTELTAAEHRALQGPPMEGVKREDSASHTRPANRVEPRKRMIARKSVGGRAPSRLLRVPAARHDSRSVVSEVQITDRALASVSDNSDSGQRGVVTDMQGAPRSGAAITKDTACMRQVRRDLELVRHLVQDTKRVSKNVLWRLIDLQDKMARADFVISEEIDARIDDDTGLLQAFLDCDSALRDEKKVDFAKSFFTVMRLVLEELTKY